MEDQCSDRVHRIGQCKPGPVYYPLATLSMAQEHRFDIQLQGLMGRKRQLAPQLLTAAAFTRDDYEHLLAGIRLKQFITDARHQGMESTTAERALRTAALGRPSFLVAGSGATSKADAQALRPQAD